MPFDGRMHLAVIISFLASDEDSRLLRSCSCQSSQPLLIRSCRLLRVDRTEVSASWRISGSCVAPGRPSWHAVTLLLTTVTSYAASDHQCKAYFVT